MKHHHLVHWIGLPLLLVGSDLFIGFFGHYSGSVEDILNLDHFISYISSPETFSSLLMVVVVAVAVLFIVEWIVKERTKGIKK